MYPPAMYRDVVARDRRDACLRARGFEDPFREVKREEDARALALLPTVLRRCSSLVVQEHLRGQTAAGCHRCRPNVAEVTRD